MEVTSQKKSARRLAIKNHDGKLGSVHYICDGKAVFDIEIDDRVYKFKFNADEAEDLAELLNGFLRSRR